MGDLAGRALLRTTGLAYAGYTLFVKMAETAAHDVAGKTIEKL
jgi:hypothetical protein